jgi:hypothetical protein
MGFDVIGKKGTDFRNNVWGWRPLADYCMDLAPEIAEKCECWHLNEGGGLEEEDALALADRLQQEIDSGRCAAYETDYSARIEAMPEKLCRVCEGTGIRNPGPGDGHGGTSVTCYWCEGSGRTKPWEANYPFSVENVRNFIAFLRGCGGFEIW